MRTSRGAHRRRVRPVARAGAVAALLAGLSGCDDQGQGDREAFCAELESGAEVLRGDITDPAAAQAAIDVMAELVELAPPSIADDAQFIHDLLVTAAAIDPTSTDAVARVLELATGSEAESASRSFNRYASQECGVEMSPTKTAAPASTRD